ncbi:hypothetical protein BDV32DRAFT_160007 [Aspergillus pseudonomiae]|uniref:Uncharacterized protein n=1 Tax=Aspergillus pseudonomiae TaxID=1506151 RepID=A0A5N7DQP6_9EURO|nr:uncharacterized protein BDV37DRAFT_297475 [Aspergillus pseudonomiae]KAB8258291.1 hypothetical protein BDV32DRAFT_160007 [Aspergillus pseudonomiae]KAE8407828.1 hypothetical protein BDV37DRAFT_297475 [Aspergillus pseudonomiae]
MQDSADLVGREVERLITAPYAPSLQDLYELVEHTPTVSLRSWAFHKPCQVGALVDALVDGLSCSSFALHLISSFTSLAAFRDSLLERYPCILDQFLQKAIEDDGTEYIPVCTAILSSPLPADFIPPARLAPFLRQLIITTGDNPCAERILPIYKIMTGLQTSPRVLHSIPSEIMCSLQIELTKTLRNLDDHMGNLLCLATFARVASSQKLSRGDESAQQVPGWLQSINHFFGAKRGLKTLDLVVLRVILACSTSCQSLMADQAAESIRLGIDICATVEGSQRETWIQTNSSKIAKLCEKVTRDNTEPEVQMLGITFLISLLPTAALPSGLPEVALHWLLSENSTRILEALPQEYISRLAEANVLCPGQTAICRIMDYVIAALSPRCSTNAANVDTIQVAQSLVIGLQNAVSHGFSSTAAEATLTRLKGSIDELIEDFPRRPYLPSCQNSAICYIFISETENELLYELFSLYFQASLSRSPDQKASHMAHIDSFRAFILKARKPTCHNICSFSEIKPLELRGTLSSLTIRDGRPSSRNDWRAGLSETLMLNARTSHDSMIQKVEEICHDLERRCGSIEAPLRAVEEERHKISLEAQELKRHNDEMELQLQQASKTINELQENLSCLTTHAETASARIDELTVSLDAARGELEDQRRDSRETANQDRENARTRELDLIASVAEKEEQLEQLQEDVHQQREESGQLQQMLDARSKERDAVIEQNAILEQDVAKLRECVEENRLLLTGKVEEVARLQAAKEDIEAMMGTLQSKLNEEVSESDNIKSALCEAELNFKIELATVREQFEAQLSASAAEDTKQKEEIASLQATIQTAASAATKELQTKEKRIQYLEKKVQHLRDERAAKAREFSEAQQHITRLMAVMGWKPDTGDTASSDKQSRPRTTLGPSQTAVTQQQTRPEAEYSQPQADNILVQSFETDTSHFGGRSPKRSRITAFSMAELPAESQDNTEKKSRHSVYRSGGTRQSRDRVVLGDTNQNSQPSSQESNNSNSNRRRSFKGTQSYGDTNENHLQDVNLDMDLEFSKDFLFTSTSLSQATDEHNPRPKT